LDTIPNSVVGVTVVFTRHPTEAADATFDESLVRPHAVLVKAEESALSISRVIDSLAALVVNVTVAVTVAVSPGATDAELALKVKLSESARSAFEFAPPRTPKLNAATRASATRLKVVDFVVIYFLSKVVFETFPNTADRENSLSCDAMHVLLHHIPYRVSGRGKET